MTPQKRSPKLRPGIRKGRRWSEGSRAVETGSNSAKSLSASDSQNVMCDVTVKDVTNRGTQGRALVDQSILLLS